MIDSNGVWNSACEFGTAPVPRDRADDGGAWLRPGLLSGPYRDGGAGAAIRSAWAGLRHDRNCGGGDGGDQENPRRAPGAMQSVSSSGDHRAEPDHARSYQRRPAAGGTPIPVEPDFIPK